MLFLLSTGIILRAPAVIGLFWGAPLIARELETGTAALAWNQSLTRTRWLAVKLAIAGLTAMAVTEALSLMQTWWAVPISQAAADGSGAGVAQSRFSQLNFSTDGITPIGYAAFAFTLGVTAGALIRRTIPAMAVTLAIFAALQVAMPLWIRPNLAPADHVAIPVSGQGNFSPAQSGPGGSTFTLFAVNIPGQPGAWLLSSGPVNAAGQPVSTTPAACASIANTRGTNTGTSQATQSGSGHGRRGRPASLPVWGSHGIREAITYQPASRYWRFQATETAIYLALAWPWRGTASGGSAAFPQSRRNEAPRLPRRDRRHERHRPRWPGGVRYTDSTGQLTVLATSGRQRPGRGSAPLRQNRAGRAGQADRPAHVAPEPAASGHHRRCAASHVLTGGGEP